MHREATAKADGERAGFVDKRAAAEIDKRALGDALRACLAAVSAGVDLVKARSWCWPLDHPRRHADRFSPQELIIAVVVDTLAHAAPELFAFNDTSGSGNGSTLSRAFELDHDVPVLRSNVLPPPARRDAARVLISDRLRARAAALRAGPTSEPPQGREAAE